MKGTGRPMSHIAFAACAWLLYQSLVQHLQVTLIPLNVVVAYVTIYVYIKPKARRRQGLFLYRKPEQSHARVDCFLPRFEAK